MIASSLAVTGETLGISIGVGSVNGTTTGELADEQNHWNSYLPTERGGSHAYQQPTQQLNLNQRGGSCACPRTYAFAVQLKGDT